MSKTLVALAGLVALPLAALAQTPVHKTATVEITAAIEAIDHSTRTVTLVDGNGGFQTIYCGSEVKRFDELKVGDTVTFRYTESLAYQIRKPGQPGAAPSAAGAQVTRTQGPKPGGTLAQQETATVTIKTIDANVPSVTVITEDGRITSFRVENKENLKDVKVGDRVEVTFTKALAISVK